MKPEIINCGNPYSHDEDNQKDHQPRTSAPTQQIGIMKILKSVHARE